MLQAEAEFLLTYIQELWPRWAPNEAEKDATLGFLLPYPDSDKLKLAARKHWENYRFNKPTMTGIKQELSILSARQGAEGLKENKDPQPSKYYIECVKAHAKFPGRKGWRVPIIWANGEMPENENKQWEIIEQMRLQHQELYGGEWQNNVS